MSALYPTSTITFTTKTNKVDIVDASHINTLQEEVQAIEETLGKSVQGSATNLVTRLARCLATSGDLRSGTTFPTSEIGDGTMFYRTDEDIVYVYDGSGWDSQSGQVNYAAGSYQIDPAGKHTDSYSISTSYVKYSEIRVARTGTLTIKFYIASNDGATIKYGRIYRNGVAVGTERSQTSATITEYSEDISGWTAGDLCQLYVKSGGTDTMKVGLLRLFENTPVREYSNDTQPRIYYGTGAPNSSVGVQGDLFIRTDGSTSTTLYVKTGASTWTAK